MSSTRIESAASASWAGAGRLAPFTDSDGGDEEEDFLATALGLYQVFVKELHKRTGVDPYLRIDGVIEVAHDDAAVVRLRDRAAALVARGIHAHWFEPDEVRRLEPFLGPATLGASLIEDEGQIDNRELGQRACVWRAPTSAFGSKNDRGRSRSRPTNDACSACGPA